MREIALAAGFGATSSSCSYAAIAAAKSMFKRGAHLIPALAFMFASTFPHRREAHIPSLPVTWQVITRRE
ncbi:hypothetical protein KSD_57620 [Ktedonobacter sp. SOSP1-85]|uniref:permease n=1 Tax=Ktedonobacter sp. SOSP1-85 TaxID=2778367 RepID=UPI001915CDD2|nr:permease [Ktedonobacter sp. SOSP1-85]GHO77991.1 hypothetical protein KSD_57620 [Ktedonobacter sp. SOSP1-85]